MHPARTCCRVLGRLGAGTRAPGPATAWRRRRAPVPVGPWAGARCMGSCTGWACGLGRSVAGYIWPAGMNAQNGKQAPVIWAHLIKGRGVGSKHLDLPPATGAQCCGCAEMRSAGRGAGRQVAITPSGGSSGCPPHPLKCSGLSGGNSQRWCGGYDRLLASIRWIFVMCSCGTWAPAHRPLSCRIGWAKLYLAQQPHRLPSWLHNYSGQRTSRNACVLRVIASCAAAPQYLREEAPAQPIEQCLRRSVTSRMHKQPMQPCGGAASKQGTSHDGHRQRAVEVVTQHTHVDEGVGDV